MNYPIHLRCGCFINVSEQLYNKIATDMAQKKIGDFIFIEENGQKAMINVHDIVHINSTNESV
jgi:hypothetical protein